MMSSHITTLEQELRLVVPLDDYIDLSTVPALYHTKLGKKLIVPQGIKNVSRLVESFPTAFEVKRTLSANGKVTYLHVIQLSPVSSLQSVATAPLAILKPTAPSPLDRVASAPHVPNSTITMSHTKSLAAKPVTAKNSIRHAPSRAPRELNERGEVGVSLSQLTASLHGQRTVVPLGGLADFICAKKSTSLVRENVSLITDEKMSIDVKAGASILGFNSVDDSSPSPEGNAVFINSADPFCAVCIGVQGAGKSHTMNVILENCMLNTVVTESCPIVSNPQPMCGLVLHYDQSESNCCEAVGLNSPAAPLSLFPSLKVQRLVVLASPTYYLQRKAFYGDTCEVIPLLFDWDTLSATQLKKLMRLSDSDAQLYVSVILNKLREYQRKNKIPSFNGFLEEVLELCNVSGQTAPLQQRLELLKTVVRESEPNQELRHVGCTLSSLLEAGTLVVADLTDPMMSADEACGVFQVLLEQFRGHPLGDVGKVVTFDEAHKYLNKSGPGCVELSNAIVDTVRLMRHEGIRVLISTQSPLTMPPELLELTSVTILHKFQSADWAKYLGSKVTLPPEGFHEIQSLGQGQALLLSTQISSTEREGFAERAVVNHLKVNIRPRLTLDLGASRRNRAGAEGMSDEGEGEDEDEDSDVKSEVSGPVGDDGQDGEQVPTLARSKPRSMIRSGSKLFMRLRSGIMRNDA